MFATNLGAMGVYISTHNPNVGLACLGVNTVLSFVQGWSLTAAIGG